MQSSRAGGHQSSVFIPPSSVGIAEDYRVPSIASDSLPRRLSRRQQAPISSRATPTQRTAHEGQESMPPKDVLAKTMAKVWFERNADRAHVILKKSRGASRTKDLRKLLDYLDDTEWYYTPVDELIGQY